MNTKTLLYQMCHHDLSQTDIKAIGKSRGFTAQEFATPTMLESIYLSPIGIEKAMATLTPAEAAMLHLLHIVDDAVPIDWFERLYGLGVNENSYHYFTYTQRFQPVFKEVRTKLVRKGILIMAQVNKLNATKMEKWQFLFPQEFAPYLPVPSDKTTHLTTPGETLWDVSRKKLLTLINKSTPPKGNASGYKPSLKNGQLFLGDKLFTTSRLREWQTASWQAATPKGTVLYQSRYDTIKKHEETPLDSIQYLFGLLPPDEWIQPKQLDDALKIFCLRSFNTEDICNMGWQWGYLAKNLSDGSSYYRLAAPEAPQAASLEEPDNYLSVLDDNAVAIDLQKVPYDMLAQLNQMAFLQLDAGRITAVPHLARMGETAQTLSQSPLLTWLKANSPAFADAWKTVNTRWGKQIIHTNLHVARIKDLALRVKITQTLKPHECLSLSDEYIAFPPKLLPKVKRIVEQAGHVIKNHGG